MIAVSTTHSRGRAHRWARLSLALTLASVAVLSGTAASAMGYLPAPPSLSVSPAPASTPFAGPASLHLGFMPAGSNCTASSLSRPYRLPEDGRGQIDLSGTLSGHCSLGDWAEVFMATSFGNPWTGTYRVDVSLGVSTSPTSPPLQTLLTAFLYLPVSNSLLTFIVRVDLGAVFPAGGVSMNVAFAGPVPA